MPPDSRPQGSPSFLRFALLGCGILAGVVLLGMGGCAGFLVFVYQGPEKVADLGADYLRNSPEIQKVAGTPIVARRNWTRWKVNIHNKTGDAYFTYDVEGPRARGYGEATLIRSAGTWSARGGRFSSSANPEGDILLGEMRKLE